MPRFSRVCPGVTLLLALVSSFAPPGGHAGPSISGRWTSKYDPAARWLNAGGAPSPAVHMILTRGYGGYHSQILWYDSHTVPNSLFHGGLMGWKPESTATDGDCSSYPATRLIPLTLGNPATNIFCSGHSALASGKILITGGTEKGEVGMTSSIVFDPATRTWSPQGEMAQRRWYPTNTTLPDGRVMVSSGSRFAQMHGFGGRNNAGTLAADSLEFLGMTLAGQWNGRGKTVDLTSWPLARDAHTSCWNPTNSEWTLLGGRNQNGTYRDDTYFMYQNPDKDQREDYTAIKVAAGSLPPSARAWGSLVAPADSMILFGGLEENGVLNDVHSLWRFYDPLSGAVVWSWRNMSSVLAGTAPSARHGHTAVWDTTNKRMLVFGGAAADGTPLDSTLYALSIADTGAVGWSTPTVEDDDYHGRPSMRDGHLLVNDPYERTPAYGGALSGYKRRFVLFGGRKGSSLLNDLWLLWVPSPGAGNYRWQKVNPGGTLPSGRFHLAGDFDYNDRLVITGGDLGGTVTDQTWAIPGEEMTNYPPEPWVALAPNPNGPRTNHSMFARRMLWARQQEVFNPATGQWATLGTPPAQKSQDWYPSHFVLPNSDSLRVFAAGPDTSSYVLNLTANPPTWRFVSKSGTVQVPFRGGSAVMYRPGSFMKCGSRDTDRQDYVAFATTKTLDISTTTYGTPPATWTTRQDMGAPRVNHNLTILPTGQVLVNGGTQKVNNDGNEQPVFTPQLWNPTNKTWSAFTGTYALAPDNTIRGYHSNAILLPDGRVLSSSGASYTSGDSADLDSKRVTIFCPPYLFDANGNLKSRPTLVSAPDSIDYGTSFAIEMSTSATIVNVCLIKPAASTHAFNQDQRYLPLTFEACDNWLSVTAPASARWAPPGDYMLFIVRSDNMPSIARWVRIGAPDPNGELPPCQWGGFAAMSGESGTGWSAGEPLATAEESATASPMAGLEAVSGQYALRITQGDASHSTIDRVRLTAVDHAADAEAFAARDRILIGTRLPALAVRGPGGDLTGPATEAPNQALTLAAGSGIDISLALPGVAGARSPLVFEARVQSAATDAGDAAPAIRILTRGAARAWTAHGSLTPRPNFATFAVDSCTSEVRIECDRAVQIRRISSIAVVTSRTRPIPLSLVSASRDAAGVAGSELANIDPQRVELGPGETLTLHWGAEPVAAGFTRSLFADVESRTSSTLAGSASLASLRGIAPAEAWTFALGASRPNPSSGQAQIDYSLAHPTHVRIRIFDAAGRQVRRLIDKESAGGPHVVVWDGTNDHGRPVGSGVFFYRMNAGNWQSQKKMLLVRAD